MENNKLQSSELSVVASDVLIEGKLNVKRELHFFGKVVGEILGSENSLVLLKSGSVVDGKVTADEIIIDGYVKGDVRGRNRVWITSQARVIGTVQSPSLQVDPGAIFDASVKM